ncbi:TonB-dependent receptor [bacterium]|nr:MAG: TonB-dependent receptor [bacterium]
MSSTKSFAELNKKAISTLLILLGLVFFSLPLSAQNKGVILGKIIDKNTQEPLIGVSILLQNTNPLIGTTSDANGRFKIEAPVGSYNVQASYVGYITETKFNIVLTSGNATTLNFELAEDRFQLDEVKVVADRRVSIATLETPLSIQRLTTEEIRSNPGGNFDISRVIQALPGVGSTAGSVGGFRNDIIIRGGAPNENVYYLDGIEIPVINHFSTQGSAGGPQGILNVSFIEDVTLSTSAFDARYDNALASVLSFKQREGNTERFQGNFRLSASEVALTTEGPAGENTSYIASVRRSYLQFLFEAIDLPIRPNYWDFQTKVSHQIDENTSLNFIGVGAIDDFAFAEPRETTLEKEYVLRSNPSINQWSYTGGVSLKRLIDQGYWTLALSRNELDNRLDQFEDRQIGDESRRTLKLESRETENKVRFEYNKYFGKWSLSAGVMSQYVQFTNNFFNRLRQEIRDGNGNIIQPEVTLTYNTELDFFRYGGFAQLSGTVLDNRLGVSFGLRTDMNSFTNEGNNLIETLSPRLSISYILAEKWNLNASVGRYYKIPIYTTLGYQENGEYVNRSNTYLGSDHYVAGLEYLPFRGTRFTIEGFWKNYFNYPISVRDGISLANFGGNFGSIGNERVSSNGDGRAYGTEFLFQQKLIKDIFATFSYTYVTSEFSGADGILIPSSWDSRHLISAIFGWKIGKTWELGLKYRYASGAPYTPFDDVASQRNYASLGVGVLDYTQLNALRLGGFQQLDLRIDKKWNFKKATFDLFLDVTNVFGAVNPAYPQYTFQRTEDNSGFATTDGQPLRADGSNAIPVILDNSSATVLPTFGFVIEF